MKWHFMNFDRKDVYSAVNAEDAEQFVQEKYGYFADSLEELSTVINNRDNYKLACVEDYTHDKRFMYEEDGEVFHSSLFIPEDKIKAVKSEGYRMFKDVYEFVGVTRLNLGDHVFIRKIGQKSKAKFVVSGFYYNDKDKLDCVHLGADIFPLSSLFNDYEYMRMGDNGWHRFVVKE